MKKFFIIIAVTIIIISAGIYYLNSVILPKKVKSALIEAISSYTASRVELESVGINIFKGVVLKGLVIYDKDEIAINIKEASCTFWPWGLIRKKVVFPSITINSCRVFLERHKDNTLNLIELFKPKVNTAPAQAPLKGAKHGEDFSVEAYRINIINCALNFKDSSFASPFVYSLNDIDLSLYLSLPSSVKFKGAFQMPGSFRQNVNLEGEMKLPKAELTASLSIKGLSLKEFAIYYSPSGLKINDGLADALFSVNLKDKGLNIICRAQTAKISAALGDFSFDLGPGINAQVISNLDKMEDFSAILDLSGTNLRFAQKFGPLEDVRGKFYFTPDNLSLKGARFKYLEVPYALDLSVKNFNSPDISLVLSGDSLNLKSVFAVNKNRVNIKGISGKCFNSDFAAAGSFDTASSLADISGSVELNLEDLNKISEKIKDQLSSIKPGGNLHIKFNLTGDVRDIKACKADAQASGGRVSLYGLNGTDLACYYHQEGGIAELPFLNFSFYGGKVSASAKADLNLENLPFSLGLAITGAKLEELKADTAVRDRDVSGIIDAQLKASGALTDFTKLSGNGSLSLAKGKLWELNIFRGLGKLLFVKEFAQMVFHKGSCNFIIKDSAVSTGDFILESNVAYLYGRVKLGFDGSIDALVNMDVIDKLVPLSGGIKEIATDLLVKSWKVFGISVTGTLKEPKYKLKPFADSIINNLAVKLKEAVFKSGAEGQ
jgi:hypothetical protein